MSLLEVNQATKAHVSLFGVKETITWRETSNWWYWVSRGHSCLYILQKVEIWIGVTDASRTDSLTTLKDRATQLLIKYKSGALVTQLSSKHRKNCKSCPTQESWKVKFIRLSRLSCPVCPGLNKAQCSQKGCLWHDWSLSGQKYTNTKTTYGSNCNIEVLTIFLDPKIATRQLLCPNPGGVCEFTHKFSANSTLRNGPFCKKCVFAFEKKPQTAEWRQNWHQRSVAKLTFYQIEIVDEWTSPSGECPTRFPRAYNEGKACCAGKPSSKSFLLERYHQRLPF